MPQSNGPTPFSKFYAVRIGKKPGIYLTWDECQAQVHKFSGNVHQSFFKYEDAQKFMAEPIKERFRTNEALEELDCINEGRNKAEKNQKQERRKWTEDEKNAIEKGFLQFGPKWWMIKEKYIEVLGDRSSVQIKDCFRTMCKNDNDLNKAYKEKLVDKKEKNIQKKQQSIEDGLCTMSKENDLINACKEKSHTEQRQEKDIEEFDGPSGGILTSKTSAKRKWDKVLNIKNGESSSQKRKADDGTYKAKVKPKQKRRKWTKAEKNAIKQGVKQFGSHSWQKIKEEHSGELGDRTNVQIKDCYRTMKKNNEL